jgi:RNA polymerase sigma-70 factor (ECF subfamily)
MNIASDAVALDIQLMVGVRDGDTRSFTLLLDRHQTPVIHFLYRLVQNQAIAEELTQEVFLRVYKSRASYEPTAKFTTWLFRIATHLALNWLRDERYEQNSQRLDFEWEAKLFRQVPDATPTVEESMLKEARAKEIRDAISSLPAKQRAAVVMHKYQEMDYSQIAVVLGCSESAVKSVLFRAYARLRSRLSHLSGRLHVPVPQHQVLRGKQFKQQFNSEEGRIIGGLLSASK